YGTVPACDSPSREPDAQHTYEFARWTPDIEAATENAEYTAEYDAAVRYYTVTYLPGDYGTFSPQGHSAPYGSPAPAFEGTPACQEGHRFAGWSPNVQTVTGDAEYVAQWAAEGYAVVYMVDGVQTGLAETHGYREDVAVRERYEKTGFAVSEWHTDDVEVTDGMFVMPAKDVMFEAETSPITYAVTWKDWDGSVLAESSVQYGETPSFPGDDPSRDGYVFTGWEPEVSACYGDTEYVAAYEKVAHRYAITWQNWDGSVLLQGDAAPGEVPAYVGPEPSRPSEDGKEYRFAGWSPDPVPATEDAVYTAAFDSVMTACTVTYLPGELGSFDVQTYSVPYGSETPAFDGIPAGKDGREFAGWEPEVSATVTGDAVYIATFSALVNDYTVKYLPGAHGTFTEQSFTAVSGSATPAFAGTPSGDTGYRFAGWMPEVSETVSGDAEYVAQWVAELYEVSYEVDGIQVGEAETHAYGETVTVREKYEAAGSEVSDWSAEGVEISDGAFSMPARDVVFKATSTPVTFSVSWRDWDGSVLAESVAQYGETPLFPGNDPTRDGYVFAGWEPEVSACYEDAVYVAVYNAAKDSYQVVWKDWDGSVLLTMTVRYGVMPIYPFENPTRPSDGVYDYEFKGWRPAVSAATSDKEYVAEYLRTESHVPVKVTGITVDKAVMTLGPGCSAVLTAKVAPSDADVKDVTWSSDKPGVASVDEDGRITAIKPGTAVVKATTIDGGFSASCTVTVTPYEYVVENGIVTKELAEAIASAASPGETVTISSPVQSVSVPAGSVKSLGDSGCAMRFLMGDGTSVSLDASSLKTAGSKDGTVMVSAGTSCPELASKVPSGAVIRDVSVSNGSKLDVPAMVSVPFSGTGPVQASALIDGKAEDVPVTLSSGKAEVHLPSASPTAVYVPEPEPAKEGGVNPFLIAGCAVAILAMIAAAMFIRKRR
ncbi:MAG: InlB B-repeat-containing protein, partial [Candidatus Methanomethylophilaceae archaeon]|nr:InlB B-repeat-containing protein [Candidatus Methanomethylophilaceae archaeon]